MSTTGDARGTVRTEVVRLPGGAGLWVVRAEGGLRDAAHPAPAAAEPPEAEYAYAAVVIDLTLVPLVSAAGVRALVARARELADHGVGLLVATADEAVARVLSADGALPVFPGVAEAAAHAVRRTTPDPVPTGQAATAAQALTEQDDTEQDAAGTTATKQTPAAESPAESATERELARLRQEIRNLRARARTHPLVSRAQGILEERYQLPDDRAAFALLEASSQRFNVRLRALAAGVVTMPRPRGPHREWFPGRQRRVPPPLPFQRDLRPATANTAEVLGAVLRRSLEITGATAGTVHLVDPVSGDLRLEKHKGIDDGFLEFFDRVSLTEGGAETPCSLGARQSSRVTVTDVATADAFAGPARRVVLAAGIRGCHSTPLLAGPGRVQGMVSTHHPTPVAALTAAQARTLDGIGLQAGRWLDWYQRTVVLDALEDLHRAGSSRGRDTVSVPATRSPVTGSPATRREGATSV